MLAAPNQLLMISFAPPLQFLGPTQHHIHLMRCRLPRLILNHDEAFAIGSDVVVR